MEDFYYLKDYHNSESSSTVEHTLWERTAVGSSPAFRTLACASVA